MLSESACIVRVKKHTVRKGVDFGVFRCVSVNAAEASQGVLPIDVHSTRPANSFSTRTTECQCGVHLVLDFDESIENLDGIRDISIFGLRGRMNSPFSTPP